MDTSNYSLAVLTPVGTAVSNFSMRTAARLMIRPSRIATLTWRFRRGRRAVVAADGALA
jgi:hypothetical protein